MKTLRTILSNTAEISQRLEKIEHVETRLETRLDNVESRLGAFEERFKAPTIESGKEIQDKTVKSLSRAESHVYEKVQEIQRKCGEVSLNNLREELKLDYRTVAGYTNRLVKYGILNERWDPVRRVNLYWIDRK
jgi:hypothetical protein